MKSTDDVRNNKHDVGAEQRRLFFDELFLSGRRSNATHRGHSRRITLRLYRIHDRTSWAHAGGKGCTHKQKGTSKIAECWGPAPLRWGRRWPPRNRGYPAEFGRFRSNGTSVIKEIRLKNSTPRVPQFKVTEGHGTDTYRSATCNFL